MHPIVLFPDLPRAEAGNETSPPITYEGRIQIGFSETKHI